MRITGFAAMVLAAAASISTGCGGPRTTQGKPAGKSNARPGTGSNPQLQNQLEQQGKTARENLPGQAMEGSFRSPQEAQRETDRLKQPAPPAAKKAPSKPQR